MVTFPTFMHTVDFDNPNPIKVYSRTGTPIQVDAELLMDTQQLKQLSLLLSRQLDVWLMPDYLAGLGTAHRIAEHVEGELASSWIVGYKH